MKGGKYMKRNLKKIVAGLSAAVLVLGGIGIYKFVEKDPVVSVVLLDVNPSIELHVDDDGEIVRAVALNPEAEKVLEGMKLRDMDVDTAVNAIVGSLLKNGYVDELANSILLSVEDENTVRGAKLKKELTEEINAILSATAANVRGVEVDFDYEYGKMVYELDFASAEYEYDYSIDAKTGEVLHSHKELDDDYVAPIKKNEAEKPVEKVEKPVEAAKPAEATDIGKDKAKAIALSNAGLTESQVTRLHVERDRDDGRIEYNVEFTANGKEYDYEISGSSGKILDYDVEVADRD